MDNLTAFTCLPEELQESMLLSPEARSFIVAKCLQKAQDYSALVDSFLPGCLVFCHYVGGVHINESLGFMKQPRPLRLAVQSVWLSTFVVFSLYALSLAHRYFERAAIQAVVRTPSEARGAVEFFDKSLARNRVLCRILGPESKYYFTEEGEVVPIFYEFPQNVSWRGHRDYCQSLADSLQQEQDKAAQAGGTV
jgi:hypothetical protein